MINVNKIQVYKSFLSFPKDVIRVQNCGIMRIYYLIGFSSVSSSVNSSGLSLLVLSSDCS